MGEPIDQLDRTDRGRKDVTLRSSTRTSSLSRCSVAHRWICSVWTGHPGACHFAWSMFVRMSSFKVHVFFLSSFPTFALPLVFSCSLCNTVLPIQFACHIMDCSGASIVHVCPRR